MAGRCALARAGRDGPVPDAREILTVGPPASRWRLGVALPADLLAHREATDSNSVWEPQEPALRQRADAPQLRQALQAQ
jgi:hypothetical protein